MTTNETTNNITKVPATPPPESSLRDNVVSPDSRIRSNFSPPMSGQIPTTTWRESTFQPMTPTTNRQNALKDLPSTHQVDKATTEELRDMVKQLITDLTDARINSANARLQHHFLLMETSQAAERAEVENQLSRTQVEHLRVKQKHHLEYRPASAIQPPVGYGPAVNSTRYELENRCAHFEDMCDKLKRETEVQSERIQSLSEHNSLLVNRIRENREHFTRIRERSPMMYTPRAAYTTPRRRQYAAYPDDTPAHGPFAALIAADQLLSQETASVPSTPTRPNTHRVRGHHRGAHSLSSMTPRNHERPGTSDSYTGSQLLMSVPSSQMNQSSERERHDRDSTISVSDDGNTRSNHPTQSQASSLAADMLRNNPNFFDTPRGMQEAEKSSNLLQSKLFGHIKKSHHETSPSKMKRQYEFEEHTQSKRVRKDDQIGLGIEAI